MRLQLQALTQGKLKTYRGDPAHPGLSAHDATAGSR